MHGITNSVSAKYPLAVVNHILDTLGEDLDIGYDIGCAFSQTVESSHLLGPKAKEKCTSSAAKVQFRTEV
jgi:hypothetical protein